MSPSQMAASIKRPRRLEAPQFAVADAWTVQPLNLRVVAGLKAGARSERLLSGVISAMQPPRTILALHPSSSATTAPDSPAQPNFSIRSCNRSATKPIEPAAAL
jgi:hypothetical protein